MLKFKRVESGKYQAESRQGLVRVWNSKKDGKWYYSINNDKGGKKDTYANAKLAVEKVLNKPKTLAEKLKKSSAYVVGCDFTGCINSGNAACILHIKISESSYYLVGIESNVTDSIIHKYPIKIKRMLMSGNFTSEYDQIKQEYKCKDGKTIKIFSIFKDAEKAYKDLNQKTIDSNHQDKIKINEAKKVIKNANGLMTPESLEAYMELNDYGMI